MQLVPTDRPQRRGRSRARSGASRIGTVLMLLLLLALLAGVVWMYFANHPNPSSNAEPPPGPASALSDSTLATLQKLDAPVQVRFYSVLDPATTPPELSAFADRVQQMLQAYQEAAGDKLKLTRVTTAPRSASNPAAADGIQVFNLDKGDPSYLGIAMEYKGKTESLPRLAPEWEQALEPDLTRALARLLNASGPVAAPLSISQVNTAAVEQVKALFPDLAAVQFEDAKKRIQTEALKEYTAAAKELETKLKEAQQRLSQAQTNDTEAERQAAVKELDQLRAEQGEKLKEIAARSQAQIQAFQQLKAQQ